MGIFDKIREGLKKTRDNISGQITQMVNSFTKIDEELFEELEELLEVCHRILVMHMGRIVGEVYPENLTIEQLYADCMGGKIE